ncbi:hypothetical protein, partial [Klebsiella pneumoniae]|uniref:hypothetical protein n=1 Tax=Klebsiella pneumoniae TaxID=573 RepID=UPI001C689430
SDIFIQKYHVYWLWSPDPSGNEPLTVAGRSENRQHDGFTRVATSPCRWQCYDGGNFPYNNTMR